MAKGLLVRVGIDGGRDAGGWNAPCCNDGRFCYVPILAVPDDDDIRGPAFKRIYSEFIPYVTTLGFDWPYERLAGDKPCHLDPDFSHLTYGNWHRKGKRISDFLAPGDFIVFYAGLELDKGIICSIIGFYIVSYIVKATEIGCLDFHRNAHTRHILGQNRDDVVVFAKPESSGRLRKHIQIGGPEKVGRQRCQCVLPKLRGKWGPLLNMDGSKLKDYVIQRCTLPHFKQPERFLEWFYGEKPELIHANNI